MSLKLVDKSLWYLCRNIDGQPASLPWILMLHKGNNTVKICVCASINLLLLFYLHLFMGSVTNLCLFLYHFYLNWLQNEVLGCHHL